MWYFSCGERGIRQGGQVNGLAHEVIHAVTDDEIGITKKENWAPKKERIGLALQPRSSVNPRNIEGLAISSTTIN